MPRRYADGFARFGAISTRSSFALGENFLDARVVSLRVDDADGWSVVDGGAAAPEVLGEDRFDAYRASHPPYGCTYICCTVASRGPAAGGSNSDPTQIDRRASDG